MHIDPIIRTYFQELSYPFYNNIVYQYRTVSLTHFPELQQYLSELQKNGSWGTHPTFEYYMSSRNYKPPYELPNAKSVIILAYFKPHGRINLHYQGKSIPSMIPSPYYDEVENDEIYQLIRENILPHPNSHINLKLTHQVPFKLLAIRSGLGKFGRNNVCYVPGFGSSITLRAILTDCELEDNWTNLSMMESCKDCYVCEKSCPNGCISHGNFVIDVNRCLPLYNEINGEIPSWIPKTAHSCLIGCLKCQFVCPANRKTIHLVNTIDDLDESEVSAILTGEVSDYTQNIVVEKLKLSTIEYVQYSLTTLQRNINYLLDGAL